jgi:spermidine synthase
MQAECFWIHLSLIADMVACCADIFDTAEYATTLVPTYPCGQIGFLLASKGTHRTSLRKPLRTPAFVHTDLRWYSPRQHRAAFTLPPFVERELAPLQTNNHKDDEEESDTEDDYRCILSHAPSCNLL